MTILEKINKCWAEHRKMGLEPNFLYLGVKNAAELKTLRCYNEKINEQRMAGRKFMGLEIVEVKKENWLTVGI